MRIIILGAPGAGKGTQAEYICHEFKIPKISTGDILRSAIALNSSVGQLVKQVVAEGKLVSDDIIIQLVEKRLQNEDCRHGFLLDGFPRTLTQAKLLAAIGLDIDVVINIEVPDKEIIKRLSGRWTHPTSGRVYHVDYNPPKIPHRDDITHELLIQREDDKEETIIKRLEVYHQQTEPLVKWYQNQPYRFVSILGTNSVDSIRKQLKEVLLCLS